MADHDQRSKVLLREFFEGFLQGQRQWILMQLEELFGPLSPQAHALVQSMTSVRLAEVGRALLRAQSLWELRVEE